MNEQNLRPCTPENARERQLKGAQKRKENTQRRQFLSEMYADFLSEKFSGNGKFACKKRREELSYIKATDWFYF